MVKSLSPTPGEAHAAASGSGSHRLRPPRPRGQPERVVRHGSAELTPEAIQTLTILAAH
jgi:hypothetical protein